MQEGIAPTTVGRVEPARIPRVIVSCAERKATLPAEHLHARSLPQAPATLRLEEWIRRLEERTGPRFEARELYKGEHWAVAAGLNAGVGEVGRRGELWIASAGYGLVSDRSRLFPYAATFAAGHADSVAPGGTRHSSLARRAWWNGMAAWAGPEPGAPRSVAEVAAADPARPLLVALGAAYLDALVDDLVSARRRLANPLLLLVISAGARRADGLRDNILPVDAGAETVVGGSRTSLNARIAAWVIATEQDHEYDFSRVASLVRERLSKGLRPAHRRQLQDDDAILRLIGRSLRHDPSVKKSRLLREMRDAGLACEQGRFSRLYQQARDEATP